MSTLIQHSRECAFLIVAAIAGLLAGCDVTEPDQTPGLELDITTVRLELTELDDNGDPTSLLFQGWFSDPDGLSGELPQTKTLVMRPKKSFHGRIVFEDRRSAEPVDLTQWLEDHSEEIEVRYETRLDTGPSEVFRIDIADEDANGNPVGLRFEASTHNALLLTGNVRIVLSRQSEDKKASRQDPVYSMVDVEIPFLLLAAAPG